MTTHLHIRGGRVYDPANGVDGQVRDVFATDGRIVTALPSGASARTIDATGCVIMPGGVDIHCHIASSGINRARLLMGEEHALHVHAGHSHHNEQFRGGTGALTPSTFLTGYRYAAMGYTTAIEAAVAPSHARQTHFELADTPNLDAGFLLLCANHQALIELLDRNDETAAVQLIGQLLAKTGALGIKVVNPGGVAAWRQNAKQFTIETLDDLIAGTTVTPRRILHAMALAAETHQLAHPPHIHCNRLGLPGNVHTTLDTLRTLAGRRVHLTHLQFHAYAKNDKGEFTSGASDLVAYLNDHPEVTADVGHVIFGDAVTLTGDTPLEHVLWQLTGARYVSIESEMEGGCGLMPITYRDKQYLHSLQWAIGLELMLACKNPWQMLLSTDHPNGGSFLAYPAIIACLMNANLRKELMAKANQRAMKQTRLPDLTREFTLQEIAIITRAGPARALGLTHKGHLGPDADADLTIYHDRVSDPQKMFEFPRWVIKAGQVLVDDGDLRHSVTGQRLRAAVSPTDQGQHLLADWLARSGSYGVEQFGIYRDELAAMQSVSLVD